MRRALWIVPLVAALALAIWWLLQASPIEVTVHTVSEGPVEATVANTRAGTVKACRRSRLAPLAGGQVVELAVEQGDAVERGQLLMRFWSEDLEAQHVLAESELRVATARTGEACLAAELAERDLERVRPLHAQEMLSHGALDRAESEARVRRSQCIAAGAAEQAARDRVALARVALSRTELRAPFDGIVAEITGEVGEFVTPSPPGIPTPPAVDLIERGCLLVSAPIDEVDAPAVTVGAPARITLDAFRDRSFEGRVRRIAPYVQDFERQARVVEMEVEFDPVPEDAALLPGYSADAEIILERASTALRIPTEALIEGRRVFAVEGGGRLQAREIETGLGNWVWTEVRGGLEEGDRVVVSLGVPGLREGVRVDATDGAR
jgi:HlyD family secretion protein